MHFPDELQPYPVGKFIISFGQSPEGSHKRTGVAKLVDDSNVPYHKIRRPAITDIRKVILIKAVCDKVNTTPGQSAELPGIERGDGDKFVRRFQYPGLHAAVNASRKASRPDAVKESPLTPRIAEIGNPA